MPVRKKLRTSEFFVNYVPRVFGYSTEKMRRKLGKEGREMSFCEREINKGAGLSLRDGKTKSGAPAQYALDRNFSVMGRDDVFNDRKAKTRSA